jgi:C4-dicarboxylate-binding protein DctP
MIDHLRTAALALVAAGALAAEAEAQTVFRISHQLPPSHHIAVLMDEFAADVEARSGGAVDVQIFGASQAYKPDQHHPAVARGDIEGAIAVNFQWGSTVPEMNVLTIPFFFTDLGRIEKFPGSEAAAMLEAKLAEKGVRNLAWLFTTRQSIFTSSGKPLLAPADFAGVKIRGLNKLVDEGLIAAGAATSAMPGSEVYQALQTGVIDAGLTDVSAAYSRRFFEVQEFGTVSPFFSVYFHLFVNPAWFDGLPEDQRTAILEAAAAAEQATIPATEASAEAAIGLLRENGMTLHVQTPQEAEAFRAVMQGPVIDAFTASSPDAAALIAAVEKL